MRFDERVVGGAALTVFATIGFWEGVYSADRSTILVFLLVGALGAVGTLAFALLDLYPKKARSAADKKKRSRLPS